MIGDDEVIACGCGFDDVSFTHDCKTGKEYRLVEFKPGEKVFVFNVIVSKATLRGYPTLFDEATKKKIDEFGRIGHSKNEAIQSLIDFLENYKD